MLPRLRERLIVISQMLAALTQTLVLDDLISSRACWGSRGLSVMAHRATWVSSSRFKAVPHP
jgi:hypothetical protein